MSAYHVNEGSFEVGAGEVLDGTVHRLEAEVAGAPVTLVVTRKRRGGATLGELSEKRTENELENLPGFTLLGERETAYGNAPALELCARFRRNEEAAYFRRAHLDLGEATLSFAMSAPFTARDDCDAWMDGVLESLRFRTD